MLLYVKPAPHNGCFRQPECNYAPMPKEGALVVATDYYLKAIEQGDIEVVPPAPVEVPVAEVSGLSPDDFDAPHHDTP